MLLINDRQRQIFELHLVLNHRMGAHHQRRIATGDQRKRLAPLPGILAAREPCRGNAQRLQPTNQFAKMLLRQNLSRRHQSALPTSVYAFGRSQRGDHGFTGADIALQQAVHGNATS